MSGVTGGIIDLTIKNTSARADKVCDDVPSTRGAYVYGFLACLEALLYDVSYVTRVDVLWRPGSSLSQDICTASRSWSSTYPVLLFSGVFL